MTPLDRFIQSWRIRKAGAFIRPQDRVLDVGTGDGALFRGIVHGEGSVGIDPDIIGETHHGSYLLRNGFFRDEDLGGEKFDVVTLLAVVEHLEADILENLGNICAEHLGPQGRVIITVPSRQVDSILGILQKFRLVDGMHLEQHHGYEPLMTPTFFSSLEFDLLHQSTFQFGLNHLFVFEKSESAQTEKSEVE